METVFCSRFLESCTTRNVVRFLGSCTTRNVVCSFMNIRTIDQR